MRALPVEQRLYAAAERQETERRDRPAATGESRYGRGGSKNIWGCIDLATNRSAGLEKCERFAIAARLRSNGASALGRRMRVARRLV